MIMKHWRIIAYIGVINFFAAIIMFALSLDIAGYVCLGIYTFANFVVILHFTNMLDNS